MSRRIIERYEKLHEACKKYPAINLSSRSREKVRIYEKPNDYAKDGFIEVFCMEKGEDKY